MHTPPGCIKQPAGPEEREKSAREPHATGEVFQRISPAGRNSSVANGCLRLPRLRLLTASRLKSVVRSLYLKSDRIDSKGIFSFTNLAKILNFFFFTNKRQTNVKLLNKIKKEPNFFPPVQSQPTGFPSCTTLPTCNRVVSIPPLEFIAMTYTLNDSLERGRVDFQEEVQVRHRQFLEHGGDFPFAHVLPRPLFPSQILRQVLQGLSPFYPLSRTDVDFLPLGSRWFRCLRRSRLGRRGRPLRRNGRRGRPLR